MDANVKGIEESQREFVISTSRTPFLRAGWSNLYIAIMVVAAAMSQKIALHFELSYTLSMLAAAFAGVLFFVIYTRSLSKIAVEDYSMVFECAIHSERYKTANIKRINVLGFAPSFWTIVAVFRYGKFFPRIFHFSELHSSFADYREAVSKLDGFIRRTNADLTQT